MARRPTCIIIKPVYNGTKQDEMALMFNSTNSIGHAT
jgi:hypothetical protein